MRPDGTDLTTLVSFNGPNGSRPFSGIVVGTDGAIYGTTREGGAFGKGIVFRLDPATLSLSTLLTFTGSNGANPRDGLVLGPDGALYGTTDNAGPSNKGTVFRVGQDGTGFESAVSFDGANGATPVSELIRGIDGALYGTTIDAGPAGGGVAFRLRRHGWPLIQAAPQALSFGSLKVGTTSGAQLVTVSNTGGGSAGVTGTSAAGDFQVTNDCTTALVIAASCSISIRFAPTASGARSGSLTVTTDFGGPFVISLTGTGTAPAVLLSPTSLDFGLSPVGSTTPAQALTLQNTGTAPLAISSIIPSGDFASATDCPTAPATLAPGGSCSMSVTFTPAAAGPRAGTVTITDDATGTPHVVTLSGTGDLPPLASVGPMSIDFGDVRVGQTSSAQGLTLDECWRWPADVEPRTADEAWAHRNSIGLQSRTRRRSELHHLRDLCASQCRRDGRSGSDPDQRRTGLSGRSCRWCRAVCLDCAVKPRLRLGRCRLDRWPPNRHSSEHRDGTSDDQRDHADR